MDTDKYPEFELERYDEIADGVFVLKDSGITLDTKIYKYMDLSALFGIMEGHFRVSRRKDYSDIYEHGVVTLRCAVREIPLLKMIGSAGLSTKNFAKRQQISCVHVSLQRLLNCTACGYHSPQAIPE